MGNTKRILFYKFIMGILLLLVLVVVAFGFILGDFIEPLAFSAVLLAVFSLFFYLYKRETRDQEKSNSRIGEFSSTLRAGLILNYIFSSLIIVGVFSKASNQGELWAEDLLLLLLGVVTIVITIMYHTKKISNYILVGLLGVFTSIIGGILVFVGYNNVDNKTRNHANLSLKEQLAEFDDLLESNIITREEYDKKRAEIIEKY